MMRLNVVWQGLEHNSRENCLITLSDDIIEIASTISGHAASLDYSVRYKILTNVLWQTLALDIMIQYGESSRQITLSADGHGHWFKDGQPLPEFDGCIDPDISLSPLTNSLPVNRSKMSANIKDTIKVLYIDVLAMEITVTHQRYVKKSDFDYHFETVPKEFEADITFNSAGIVLEYPALFRCLNFSTSNYGS